MRARFNRINRVPERSESRHNGCHVLSAPRQSVPSTPHLALRVKMCHPTRCGRIANALVAACLLTALMLIAGCTEPGFLAHVLTGPAKVPAKFTLEPRPTLVVVDDPTNLLGDRNYPAVVAANVGFHLEKNEALDPTMIISQDRLSTLAAQLGDRYPTTPIDRIGARLKAEQVIYIYIRTVKLQVAGAYYHPVAGVEVKVIDVTDGKRLFPKAGQYDDPQTTPPGHMMSIEMKRQTIDPDRRHAPAMLARGLAERVGWEVAQLFYKHVPIDDQEGR